MSIFEFREWIESAVPLWLLGAFMVASFVSMFVLGWLKRRKANKKCPPPLTTKEKL